MRRPRQFCGWLTERFSPATYTHRMKIRTTRTIECAAEFLTKKCHHVMYRRNTRDKMLLRFGVRSAVAMDTLSAVVKLARETEESPDEEGHDIQRVTVILVHPCCHKIHQRNTLDKMRLEFGLQGIVAWGTMSAIVKLVFQSPARLCFSLCIQTLTHRCSPLVSPAKKKLTWMTLGRVKKGVSLSCSLLL